MTTVCVFKACYLFDKRAIGAAYSRPGHGVSCQTGNYTAALALALALAGPPSVAAHSASRHEDAAGGRSAPTKAAAGVTGMVMSRNLLPLVAPGKFELPQAKVTATVAEDGTITLTATATAVYVWLSTLAQGRFSQNGVALKPGVSMVRFVPNEDWKLDAAGIALLRKSLRVEHLQQHLAASDGL